MGYETYTGLIAREVDTEEADRYLTILTVESGKIECYAKGIRRAKSKLAPQAGLMTYGEFMLFRSKDRFILTSAKSIESFYNIRIDVEKYAYATHFLEVARDVIVEAQAFPQAVQTLLNTLYVLCYRDISPAFIARVFETRILALAGFAPMLDCCSICGAHIPPGECAGFAAHGDGAVCRRGECADKAGQVLQVSQGTLRAVQYIIDCDANAIFSFSISKKVADELAALIPEYLRYHLGKEYKILDEAERYKAFEREIKYLIDPV